MIYDSPEEELEAQRRVEHFMLHVLRTDRVVFQNELKAGLERTIPHGGRFESDGHLLRVFSNPGLLIDTHFIRLEFLFSYYVDGKYGSRAGVNVSHSGSPKGLDMKKWMMGEFLGYFHSFGRNLGLLDTPQPLGIR